MKIFVDMDGVLCDYDAAFKRLYNTETCQFPQKVPGFFKTLDPMPGAIEGINALAGDYDVYILTAPSVKNPHCWTEKAQWVEQHLGKSWLNKLIITKQKGLLHSETERTYLIDDHNIKGGRDLFFDAGHLFWFKGEDACWLKVKKFFDV